MSNFQKAVTNYLSAKSFLNEAKDLDRILYAKSELKKTMRELTKFQEVETDTERLNLIHRILNN
jgi:superfamily II helicase